MFSKPVQTITHGERTVVVRQDPETGEYRARLFTYGRPYLPADYFTDDAQDALCTAALMAKATSKAQ